VDEQGHAAVTGNVRAYVREQALTARAASDWYVEHLIKDPMN
jgi:hypothetical protein